ncbi:MAG: FAD/NAD(P)-binding protein, partial [Pseudomonadota bacterium]|nr:FAD/NAD(P)-binding protein [Pseudomonadota bacterium]
MTAQNDTYRIAVIGFGPRGLGAVEALAGLAHDSGARLHIDIFDTNRAPGAGPNFDPGETPLCLLNVPVRDVDLPHPLGNFKTFSDWLAPDNHPDTFPTRAQLGRYFTARRDHLCDTLPAGLTLTFHDCDVSHISPVDGRWQVSSGEHATGRYDEVLVTVGQPETHPDDQLARWQTHAADTGAELAQVYPARDLMQRAKDWAGKTVGLRGLGLSTLDALRVLTLGQGGEMRDGRYMPSGREPALIVPFSLDGQPPAPKPETGQIDALFTPTHAET